MTFMKLLDYPDILLADITHKIGSDNFHIILEIFHQIKIYQFTIKNFKSQSLLYVIRHFFKLSNSFESLVPEIL